MQSQLRALAARPVVKMQSLATTLGGREVLLLTIGSGDAEKKPAILIVGSVDAAHLLGSELAVRLADRLSAPDEQATKLRERFTFYVIPRPSPDASERFFARPTAQSSVNQRKLDEDNDGRIDEDGPDDLNSDGLITMMRVEDPAGDYIASPADPRIMVRADAKKGERGRYKLYTEGLDNDGDEKWNEDGPGGVAFNRNFTFNYDYFSAGAGPHQVSEIETRAVADFCFSHPNIAAVFCFGPQDNLMSPWKPGPGNEGRIKTAVLGGDAPLMEHIADAYRKLHSGKDAPASPPGDGAFLHWAYFHYGRWAFGARGWWVPKVEEKKADAADDEAKQASGKKSGKGPAGGDTRSADQLNALRWMEQQKINGFVDWTAVEHPDFAGKKVEVGGFKPYVLLNPPPGEIDRLSDVHVKFIAELAQQMPRIRLGETKVEPLGAGVYRVTAEAVNDGYLATMSQMGKTNGEPQPLQMELVIEGDAQLLTGPRRVQIDPLAGSGGRTETVWLVRTGAAQAKVRVWSPSVGADEKAVTLR